MEIQMLKIKVVKRFNSKKDYLEHVPSPVIYDIDKGLEDLTIDNSQYLKEIRSEISETYIPYNKKFNAKLRKVFQYCSDRTEKPKGVLIERLVRAYLFSMIAILNRNISLMEKGLWPISDTENKWIDFGYFDFEETFIKTFKLDEIWCNHGEVYRPAKLAYVRLVPKFKKFLNECTLNRLNDCCFGDVYAAYWVEDFIKYHKDKDGKVLNFVKDFKHISERTNITVLKAHNKNCRSDITPIKLSNCIGVVL